MIVLCSSLCLVAIIALAAMKPVLSRSDRTKTLPSWVTSSPAIRFIVLTMHNSGSHFFRSILNSHPDVLMHDEVCIDFTHYGQHLVFPDRVHPYDCFDQVALSLGIKPKSATILDVLPNYWDEFKDRISHIKAIGVLLHASQGWNEPNEIEQLKTLIYGGSSASAASSSQVVKIVLLHRKNYISRSFAGPNLVSATSRPEDLMRFNASRDIKLADIENLAYVSEVRYSKIILELKDFIYITYEKLIAEPSSFLHVFHYLGIDDLSTNSGNSHQIDGPNNINIFVCTSCRHHSGLPYEYITNLQEVSPLLSNKTLEYDYELRYCMLYNNCTWHSSYCQDQLRCFLNDNDHVMNVTIDDDPLPSWVTSSPAIRFIVLTMQNSGSHFFRSILNSHPDVLLHDEVCIDFTHHQHNFHYPSKKHSYTCFDKIALSLGISFLSSTVLEYHPLFWNKFANRIPHTKAIGVLLHANQGWNSPEEIEQLRNLIGYTPTGSHQSNQVVKIVFLHRKNYVSRSFAGPNLITAKNHRSDIGSLKNIDVQKMKILAYNSEVQFRKLVIDSNDFIYITYEKLIAEPSSFLHVFHYLRIDDLSMNSSNYNHIIGPDNLSIVVSTTDRHHTKLPHEYIGNLHEVIPSLSSDSVLKHDYDLRYCMLYNNCTWYSSYCQDRSRCFLNAGDSSVDISLNEGGLQVPSWVTSSPAIRFIVLTMQNSGSHFFRSILNSHPDVLLHDEVCIDFTHHRNIQLNYRKPPFNCSDQLRLSLGMPLVSDTILESFPFYWDKFMNRMSHIKAIGVLLHANQAWNNAEEIEVLKNIIFRASNAADVNSRGHQMVRIIFLHRKNYISRSFSGPNLITASLKHHRHKINSTKDLDIWKVRNLAYSTELHYRSVISEVKDYIYVTYENLLVQTSSFLHVFHYLGIDDLSMNSSNYNHIIGSDNLSIVVSTTDRHHTKLPYEYIGNLHEVIPSLSSDSVLKHDYDLRYCMLYNNCTWYSSYCQDKSRCFLNDNDHVMNVTIDDDPLPSWVTSSPAIRFIVLTMHNSGSHFFRSILNSHHDVLLHDEVCIDFTHYGQHLVFPDRVHPYDCFDQVALSLGIAYKSPALTDQFPYYWDEFKDRISHIKAIGVLLHASQGWNEPNEIEQLKTLIYGGSSASAASSSQVVKIILLHRKNYISRSFAGPNLISATFQTEELLHINASRNINLNEIQSLAYNSEVRYSKIILELKDFIYITYEKLIAEPSSFFHVFHYLGIDDLSMNSGNSHQIDGPNNINILVCTSCRHHSGLPYEYITNLQEVSPLLSNKTLEYDYDLRYCMLYNNCTWYSSYCQDQSRCFLNSV